MSGFLIEIKVKKKPYVSLPIQYLKSTSDFRKFPCYYFLILFIIMTSVVAVVTKPSLKKFFPIVVRPSFTVKEKLLEEQ